MNKALSVLFAAAVLSGPAVASAHDHAVDLAAEPTSAPAPAAAGNQVVDVPPEDVGVATLAARELGQRNSLSRFDVDVDFRFADRAPESGIRFAHQIVDDAGKTYKPAHYDHGNGVAVADVNGDGRVDVYFTSQLGGNALYLNDGSGRFHDVTADAGVAMVDRIAVSAAFGDIDNDGDADLYVTTVRKGNALFLNDGKGRFTDISKPAGVDYVGHSSGAVFFDYDGDGRLDLFVVNVGKYTGEEQGRGGYYLAYKDAFSGHTHPERTEHSVLYRNLGGNRFEDASVAAGLHDGSWSGDAVVTDFNHDGRPDLYVFNMQGDDHYYENQGGRFVDRTAELFPKTPWGAMGGRAFDYDNDGDQDLLVTDMHSDMLKVLPPEEEKVKLLLQGPDVERFFSAPDNNIFGNAFFVNHEKEPGIATPGPAARAGAGQFQEASVDLGLENYWPWGTSIGDLNADGFRDVLITASMNFPYRYAVNSLLINNRGKVFLDASMLLGIEPRRDGRSRKEWFTLDCSGVDAYKAGQDGAHQGHKLCENRTGNVSVTSALGSRSSAILDLDGDGDLDIVTNELNDRPMVLISDLAQRRKVSWIGFRLVGRKSNRDGIGAEVVVRTGKKAQTQLVDGATGYLSHGLLPVYFGLGDVASVDSVEIRWPSGIVQTLPGPIVPGRVIEVREEGLAKSGR